MNNPFLIKVFILEEEEPGNIVSNRELLIPITDIAYIDITKVEAWGNKQSYEVILKDDQSVSIKAKEGKYIKVLAELNQPSLS